MHAVHRGQRDFATTHTVMDGRLPRVTIRAARLERGARLLAQRVDARAARPDQALRLLRGQRELDVEGYLERYTLLEDRATALLV